jgi:hypothetical protein
MSHLRRDGNSNNFVTMQIWKPSGKRKAKRLYSFCQNTKRDREENYFERYYTNGSSPWFREIKMKRLAFVSTKRMRAGHTSLKAKLNRFNIMSTAECECGDGLQTEEHYFLGLQTVRGPKGNNDWHSVWEQQKKYAKSVTELLRLEKKTISARRLLLRKQHSYIYIK